MPKASAKASASSDSSRVTGPCVVMISSTVRLRKESEGPRLKVATPAR